MRNERVVIVSIEARRLAWALAALFVLGCIGLWMGVTNSLVHTWVPRWIVLVGGSMLVVFVPLLVLSNVLQGWAVLVGTSTGLQVIYPFGLHRFSRRSRLEGDLTDATLRVVRQTLGSRLQAPLTFVKITASEGTLEFSFGSRAANPDFQERFAAWVAAGRPG